MVEITNWSEYELVSAYITGMAELTWPDYYNGVILDQEDVKTWNVTSLMTGYWLVMGDFQFPLNVNYPSMPGYIDKTTTFTPWLVIFLNWTWFPVSTKTRLWNSIQIRCAFYIHQKEKYNLDKEEFESVKS